ncbi:MAG: sigma-70 family RNA polymerase sigma factor [Anaerolineae bacterium]|nr:sigma-70 family RNA polymerase sigma factor [Anaerolineae bacterium]
MAETPTESEAEFIQAAQQGDQAAFEALVTLHQATVLSFLYRWGNEAETAQDLAQETFIKAWLALKKYNHRQKFRNWLLKIAYRTSIDFWRRQRPTVQLEAVSVADSALNLEARVSRDQQIELVRQAIQSLPEQSRTALILREYHQYSYQEIAQTLDIPPGTVMSRLNYARLVLKKRLQPLLEKMNA